MTCALVSHSQTSVWIGVRVSVLHRICIYICTINGEFAAVSSIFVCVCVEHIWLLRTCVCSLWLCVPGCSLLHAWHDGDLMFVVEYKIKTKNISISVFNVVIVTLVWLCVCVCIFRVAASNFYLKWQNRNIQVQRKTPDASFSQLELLCIGNDGNRQRFRMIEVKILSEHSPSKCLGWRLPTQCLHTFFMNGYIKYKLEHVK